MGNKSLQKQQLITQNKQIKEATPLEFWKQSENKNQDLLYLLKECSFFHDWYETIDNYLKSTTNQEKYQSFLITIIQFLLSQEAIRKQQQSERKDIFIYFRNKLKNSFFISGQFSDAMIKSELTNVQKLIFLYKNKKVDQNYFLKAIYYSYPFIFTNMRQFSQALVQEQIIVNSQQNFNRIILPFDKIEQFKIKIQTQSVLYDKIHVQHLHKSFSKIHNMKDIYLQFAMALLDYDNADAAVTILMNLAIKGYFLTNIQMQFYFKCKFFSIILYELGKLSINFSQINSKSMQECIHFFYTNQTVEESCLLMKCFDIYENSSQIWEQAIQKYIYSENSHINIFIKILESKYYNKIINLQKFKDKIKHHNCQIGKYSDALIRILRIHHKNNQSQIQQVIQLLSILSILSKFCIKWTVKQIDALYEFQTLSQVNSQQIQSLQFICLKLIIQIIDSYFCIEQIKKKKIFYSQSQISLLQIQGLLKTFIVLKNKIIKNLINDKDIHQLIFQRLVVYKKYEELKRLMRPQYLQQYNISYETVQMIILQNVYELILNNKLRSVQADIIFQMNIVKIWPTNEQFSHYLVSTYEFFKYLEDRQIFFDKIQKQKMGLDIFYSIVNNYGPKIDIIDFDYLWDLMQFIKEQKTQNQDIFQSKVTDQYLKFKIFLSNKAYSLKKDKMGYEILQNILTYQPPWISTQILKICKENSNYDEQFLMIALNNCKRGDDLEYFLKILQNQKKNIKITKTLSIRGVIKQSIKLKGFLMNNHSYILLNNELIYSEKDYQNLVAEMTFTQLDLKDGQHDLFFKLLGTQPNRAFHYALVHNLNGVFIFNFLQEGNKRNIFNPLNLISYWLKYSYYLFKKDVEKKYPKFKQYQSFENNAILNEVFIDSDNLKNNLFYMLFQKILKSYIIKQIVTDNFLSLYVPKEKLHLFIFDQNYRKNFLVDLRNQPLANTQITILKLLCDNMKIDILQLSMFSLTNILNCSQSITNQCWIIVQKLIVWGGNNKDLAYLILQKLCEKIHSLQMLNTILQYLKFNGSPYQQMITNNHLQILKSLQALEINKQFHGIIPSGFFKRQIGLKFNSLAQLSDKHAKILKKVTNKFNIFVLSKALYFFYGMNDKIQKQVLSDFSLMQEDAEQFWELRKKILKI